MYTAQKRAAALGSLALSAAMCLCAALAVTTFVLPAVVNKSTVQVALLNMYQGIGKRNPRLSTPQLTAPYKDPFAKQRVEVADLLLDLDADIDGLFHWNTKHVYVSAVIEYVSAKGEFNQAVIWDTVVNRTQSHHLQVKGQKPKYTLVDSFFGIT